MTVTLHNIAGSDAPLGYSHATAARGTTIVHVSGQVGYDADGVLAEGLAAQTLQAMLNVAKALEAAGARVEDLVKSTIYIVGWEPSKLEGFLTGAMAAREHHPFPDAALTLVGVHSLFEPGHLIEIEAVAVVDGAS
jgi:enamine deaminase RidA (YjgF/YER057c/UK114 family)